LRLFRRSCDYTCVVVDLPGAGESAWSDRTDFTFPAHAARLGRLMDHLGQGPYAVLGHDTGGSVARHLALDAGDRVRHLVLINTEIPHQRPPWIPLFQKLLVLPGAVTVLRGLLRLRAYRHSGAGFGGCFWDEGLIDGEFHRLFVAPLIRERRRAEGYIRFIGCLDWDECDGFAARHRNITCPVSFLWGRRDPTFPYEHALAMAEQFPHCVGFEAIEEARLLPHEERPDAVCAAVRRFLGSSSKKVAQI
jgi:haloalkane dehalogenase